MKSNEQFASEVIGVLEMRTTGGAVITTPARRTLSVSAEQLGAALHGDEVRAREIEAGRARILETLVRPARRLVGVIDVGRWFLCDDDRFRRALRIDASGASDDSVCGVEVVRTVVDGGPEVRLCRVFGQRASLRAEADAVLWREEIDLDFYSARARIEQLPLVVAQELEEVRRRACAP